MNYILEKLSLHRKELLDDNIWVELNDLLFPFKKVFFDGSFLKAALSTSIFMLLLNIQFQL